MESMEEQKEPLKRQLLEIEEEISQIQQSITRLESVIEKAPEAKVDIEKRIFNVQKDLSLKKFEHEIVLEKIASMYRSINAGSVSECMIFINKAMNELEHEALKAVYHTFIGRIDYDKESKKATIKIKISKQILEKINEYSKNKASIPDCGIDAFSLFIYI